MKRLAYSTALWGLLALAPGATSTPAAAAAPPSCTGLAYVLLQNSKVLSATSAVTPAAGANLAYCQVNLTYTPAINIRVGLPLNAADGGSGGVQGAWNGKVENLGGGGYAGSVGGVTGATNAGYVGSSTDTGHSSAWCNAINPATGQPNSQPNCGLAGGGFVLDPNNNLLPDQVADFIDLSLEQQVEFALSLAKDYYGKAAQRNYWNGCSTGGRQGMEMAQKHGELFDGILAGAPAMNWNRFIIAELWPPVVVADVIGSGGLSVAKYNAANAAAVAACDANDGIADGVINEPRRCPFDAKALQCTGSPSDPATCLTPQEAKAINLIWDGPRNQEGERLWGGLTRGTSFGVLLTGSPNASGIQGLIQTYVANWLYQNPNYPSLTNITMANFAESFQLSDRKFAESPTTDDFVVSAATDSTDLHELRKHGGKLLHYHGLSDPLIVPFGSLNYVSHVFDRYGVAGTQKFFRSFFYPGNGHCGGNAGFPNAGLVNGTDLFAALVNWVENGVEPDYIVAYNNASHAAATVTRKICKYPDEAVYNGSGATGDANSYHCVVHHTEPADLEASIDTARRYFEAEDSDHRGHDHDDQDRD